MSLISRRDLLRVFSMAPVAAVLSGEERSSQGSPPALPWQIGIVSRHLQWTTVEDAIEIAAEVGFDAVEWNVRTGGHVDPANVARELPRVVELTRKAGLAVAMITTSIQDASSPYAEAILETASGLGIRYYRGGQYFRYDYKRDLWQQLQELKPRIAGLAALNRKYGTVVAYHNHSGSGNIGGNIWDFWEIIKDFDPTVVGLNYDIGHATARGGSGWIDAAQVVARHIQAVAIKDVRWTRAANGTWRTEFVPVGEGMIDLKRLFGLLKAVGFRGPINVHYEHNGLLGTDVGTWTLPMSREQFKEIVRKDLDYVRDQIRDAGL